MMGGPRSGLILLPFWELYVLEAVFRGHDTFIVIAALLVIATWAAAFRGSNQAASRAVVSATWAASIAGVLTLTLWTTGESRGPGRCVIDTNLTEVFQSEQGILNLALFIPAGILGVLATRRFLLAAAVGLALTTTIETLQGAVPVLGRACDTSDLIANSAGALLGAVIGWALVRIDKGSIEPWRIRRRPSMVAAIALAAAIAALWGTAITPESVYTENPIQVAGPAQQQALRTELRKAFGTQYVPGLITFASTPSGAGNLSASIGPDSSMQLSWPETTSAEYSLEIAAQGTDHGYHVPGTADHADTAANAITIATTYARTHAPWALPGVRPTASPVPHFGWMISWRRYHGGVLMPMRLDIEIDHAGRIEQLLIRHLPDVTVPAPTLNADQAIHQVLHGSPPCSRAKPGALLAIRAHGHWIAAWRVAAVCGRYQGTITIDARTGTTESRTLYPLHPTHPSTPAGR